MKNNTWKIIPSFTMPTRNFFLDQLKKFSSCKYKHRLLKLQPAILAFVNCIWNCHENFFCFMGIHGEEFISGKLWLDFTSWEKIGPNSTGHTLSFIAAYCEGMESDKRKDFTPQKRWKCPEMKTSGRRNWWWWWRHRAGGTYLSIWTVSPQSNNRTV